MYLDSKTEAPHMILIQTIISFFHEGCDQKRSPSHIGGQVAFFVQAKLMDVVLYLARCKHMQIPHRWEPWALQGLVAHVVMGAPFKQKLGFHVLHLSALWV